MDIALYQSDSSGIDKKYVILLLQKKFRDAVKNIKQLNTKKLLNDKFKNIT
jgi:hypothetical protein